MAKFRVWANNLEYLYPEEIEANSATEAREKYAQMWEDGEILANENEFTIQGCEELKTNG